MKIVGPGQCNTAGCAESRAPLPNGRYHGQCLAHKRALSKRAMARRNTRLRQEFAEAFGTACWCCGLTDARFLTIGHTLGDGKAHRLLAGASPDSILRDLRARGWPKDAGIRPECFNCNMGANRNGGVCPHKDLGLPEAAPRR